MLWTPWSLWSHPLLPLPLLTVSSGQQRKERIKKQAQSPEGSWPTAELAPSYPLPPLGLRPKDAQS